VHGGAAGLIRKAAVSLLLFLLLWAQAAQGQEPAAVPGVLPERTVILLDVQGPIGPATRDFLVRSLDTAAEREAALVIIQMDTPGGLDASTRDIVKAILNSRVPVATYVAPEGARAASAGTYILYASHVAAMSPATHVGAATPVSMIGGASGPRDKTPQDDKANTKDRAEASDDSSADPSADPSADQSADQSAEPDSGNPADAMTKKVVNDSVAYIRGLADKRGRNADWAERAVREADSITSERALALGVIDFIAVNIENLLEQADGMTVEVLGRETELDTNGLVIERLEPDWRNQLLSVITSPTIAYLLLLIGVYGLILEGYNPGAILPGVVGAISLLLALYAMQMLPVNYAGLGLILLGIILIIAEVMAPSFGALGFGGIIAMVIGSIILIDTDVPGLGVSRPLIGSIAALASVGLLAIIWFAVRARERPVVSGREQLIGATGVALEDFDGEGHVHIHGERWNAIAHSQVYANQDVVVTGLDGLTLKVRPANALTKEHENV